MKYDHVLYLSILKHLIKTLGCCSFAL